MFSFAWCPRSCVDVAQRSCDSLDFLLARLEGVNKQLGRFRREAYLVVKVLGSPFWNQVFVQFPNRSG